MPLQQIPSVSGGTSYSFSSPLSESAGTVSLDASSARSSMDVTNELTKTFIINAPTGDSSIGDGQFYYTIPNELNGATIVGVHAEFVTAGTTGTTDIQIHNVNQAWDILSTKLTIDSGETGSDTAATPAVINATNDEVLEFERLRIDIDAVSTTAGKGLEVQIRFRLAL